jgi:hypothetical protein
MIICLIGEKTSGKSEVGKILSKKFNLPTFALAKKLKDLIKDCSGLDDSYKEKEGSYPRNVDIYLINKELKKFNYDLLSQQEVDNIRAIEYYSIGEVYRNLLTYIGTEVFRSRNEYHWIDLFKLETDKFENGFICDDCRFLNEYHFIKTSYNESPITIKIIDSRVKNKVYTEDKHITEVEYEKIPYDYMIYNTHDGLQKLEENINKLKF